MGLSESPSHQNGQCYLGGQHVCIHESRFRISPIVFAPCHVGLVSLGIFNLCIGNRMRLQQGYW